MFGLSPYLVSGAALACVAAYAGGRYEQHRHELGTQAREAHIAQVAYENAMAATGKAISAIEVQHVTVQQKLIREVVEKPVYRECLHSDDGWRLLLDTFTAPEDRPLGGGVVPETGAP